MEPSPESDERFVALLLANQSRIFRFLITLVPSRYDVDDLLQETCVTLWKNREKYDPAAGEFASWACAIAHNKVRNFRRSEATRASAQALLSEDVTEALMTTREKHPSLMDEWHQALAYCMEQLTPHQRSVVEECYGGVSIKAAAPSAGRTPNALYKALRHVRGLLHDCILKTVNKGGLA